MKNGTRSDSINLCASCRSGVTIKGASESSEFVFCRSIDKPVKIRVAECTSYENKSLVNLRTMEDTAWILVTKRAGKDIGFLRNSDFKKQYKGEDLIPPGVDY